MTTAGVPSRIPARRDGAPVTSCGLARLGLECRTVPRPRGCSQSGQMSVWRFRAGPRTRPAQAVSPARRSRCRRLACGRSSAAGSAGRSWQRPQRHRRPGSNGPTVSSPLSKTSPPTRVPHTYSCCRRLVPRLEPPPIGLRHRPHFVNRGGCDAGTNPAWGRRVRGAHHRTVSLSAESALRPRVLSQRRDTVVDVATCPGSLITRADGAVAGCTGDDDRDGEEDDLQAPPNSKTRVCRPARAEGTHEDRTETRAPSPKGSAGRWGEGSTDRASVMAWSS